MRLKQSSLKYCHISWLIYHHTPPKSVTIIQNAFALPKEAARKLADTLQKGTLKSWIRTNFASFTVNANTLTAEGHVFTTCFNGKFSQTPNVLHLIRTAWNPI